MLGFLYPTVFLSCSDKKEVVEKNIVSLKADSSIEGSFFLGTGSINARIYYFTYIKEDDSFYLKRLPIRDRWNKPTRIYEDNPQIPFVKWISVKRWGERPYMTNIEFHVPSGTIIKEFKLD
jgi:hypothetical protein